MYRKTFKLVTSCDIKDEEDAIVKLIQATNGNEFLAGYKGVGPSLTFEVMCEISRRMTLSAACRGHNCEPLRNCRCKICMTTLRL